MMDSDYALHPESDVDWADQGVCKGLTHVFFGPAAERPERRVEREAIAAAYCQSCSVMVECRTTARLNREHGFWGCENDEQRAAAGFAPRSPSRRAVVQARDQARRNVQAKPARRAIAAAS
jgi:WhiB family redox-sensing transcriptional regulator